MECGAGETCVDAVAPATGYTCEDTDGCAGDPCRAGYDCVDIVAPAVGYSCKDTDGCAGDPCRTGETCLDVVAPGTGYMCSDVDGCAGDPCGVGETCTDISAPLTGYMCSDTDECVGDPCGTGETCVDAIAPATGYACEDTDGCEGAACGTGETCVDAVAPATGYTCEDTDECAADPCRTGETCVDAVAPQTGYACEDIDGCVDVACGSGETCMDAVAPATGHTCEDTDECVGNPCGAAYSCIDAVAPETGYTCEDADGCAANPCRTGERCIDAVAPLAGYTCEEIDGCVGVDCGSGFTCVDAAAPATGYTCTDDDCIGVTCLGGTCVPAAAPAQGYSCTYQTDTCMTPFVLIRDQQPFTLTTTSSSAYGVITDVDASLVVTHSFVEDLWFELRHEGISVDLIKRQCSEWDNVNAHFDDDGAPLVCSQTPPAISGDIAPVGSLSAFNGVYANGEWSMRVSDSGIGDEGRLNLWCAYITSSWSPPGVLSYTAGASTAQRGFTDNPPTTESCPAGTVLMGLDVWDNDGGDYIWGVQAVCGKPEIAPGAGADEYRVLVNKRSSQALQGTAQGSASTQLLCPANQVVVGFSGRSGQWMDALGLRCAPLEVTGAPGSEVLGVGSPVTSTSQLGGPGGGAYPDTDCGSGMMASGTTVNLYDVYVSGFGLTCTTPSID